MIPPMQLTNPKNLDANPDKKYLRPHRFLRHAHQVGLVLSAAVLLAFARFGSAQSECTQTDEIPPNAPLNDLGQGMYTPNPSASPVQGGLYPNGYNQRPATYNQHGLDLTTDPVNGIFPRNKDTGLRDDQNGKIVMISIGMCNSSMEFGGTLAQTTPEDGFQCRVMGKVHPDPNIVPSCSATPTPCDLSAANWKNPKLFVWDCAQSGMSAKEWACPTAAVCPTASPFPSQNPWDVLDCRLTAAKLSKKQVQVVWLKEALAQPGGDNYGPWPIHVQKLQGYLEQIMDHLVDPAYGFVDSRNKPTVKMVFLSPRTRAWDANMNGHSPEPYAYETGFVDKWVIAERIDNSHPTWPWLSWGPYIWADGLNPRSDQFTWPKSYLKHDCTHPLTIGVHKVADQLLAFFKTDPVATPWFLKTPDPNAPTFDAGNVIPTSLEINAGGPPQHFHAVATFHAPATRIVEYAWTFDDGCYKHDPSNNPLMTDVDKKFPAPSEPGNPYKVHVTAIDDAGNAGFATIPVTVNAVQPRHDSVEDTKHRAGKLPRPKQGGDRKVATQTANKHE